MDYRSLAGPRRSRIISDMDRFGLANFLKLHRDALQPSDVGMAPHERSTS